MSKLTKSIGTVTFQKVIGYGWLFEIFKTSHHQFKKYS